MSEVICSVSCLDFKAEDMNVDLNTTALKSVRMTEQNECVTRYNSLNF